MAIIPSYFELRVSYGWQATAVKLSPKHSAFLFGHLFGFSSNNCGCSTYSQTRTQTTDCAHYRLR